jgi:hypothetical protein
VTPTQGNGAAKTAPPTGKVPKFVTTMPIPWKTSNRINTKKPKDSNPNGLPYSNTSVNLLEEKTDEE